MKKALLILAMLVVAVCSTAIAQCVGTPLMDQIKIGNFGELLIPVRYVINGIEEPNLDWKTYYPEDVKGMTDDEIKAKVEMDISDRCGQIILRNYENENGKLIVEERNKLSTEQLQRIKKIIVSQISKSSVDIIFEKIGTIEVKSDGQKIVSDISK